jgi:hypothetical protein
MFDQRIHDGLGVFARDLHQHHIAGMTFDQSYDVRVL